MNELGVIKAVSVNDNPYRKSIWSGLYYDETVQKWTVTYMDPIDSNGVHLITPGHDVYLKDLMNRLKENNVDGIYNFIICKDGIEDVRLQEGETCDDKKLYTAAIPDGTKEIKVHVTRGFAYIDTIILKGTFGEVLMMPHDVCDFPDTSDPLPLVVKTDGTYTNSENRMIDSNTIFEAGILPLLDIAEKYGVGFMVNELGIFATKVNWDIDVIVSYHDTLIEMLEEKGISWCYCELYNPFGKHIVLVTGESQWEGTIVNEVSYPYDDRTDILYVNQQLLDVFRKYTMSN